LLHNYPEQGGFTGTAIEALTHKPVEFNRYMSNMGARKRQCTGTFQRFLKRVVIVCRGLHERKHEVACSKRGNMKPTSEQCVSPMASFITGLNSTASRENTYLDKVGWTARIMKQIFAVALVLLIVPMGMGDLLAQSQEGPPPPPPQQAGIAPDQGGSEGAPQAQPLGPDQLDQLVAPIALYPDALVAQVLAASTYPTEVVEADRWRQAQGNIPADQLASEANAQNWDPSVKALVAFPSVLAQMDKNIQWTTDLGNAYYNQPDDVMAAVQTMRSRAQAAGTLHDTPQLNVAQEDGDIVIQPANPEVVYVPVYDPWTVYGAPIGVFPGYYYGPSAGVYFGSGLAIGFGIGIGIGAFSHWGWGYHNWGFNWRNRHVIYNRNVYITRSRTVINRGYNRPGSPRGYAGARGAYNRGGVNRGGAYNRGADNRGGAYNRGTINRGGNYNRQGQGFNRGAGVNRPEGNVNRGGQQNRSVAPQQYNRGAAQSHSAGRAERPSGGGHAGGGRPGGGGRQGGGGGRQGGGGNQGGGGHDGGHPR
jgi:hypothetical protein